MVARKTTAKQADAAEETATAKPVAARRTAAKKSTTKKAAAKKTAATKATAKKSTAKTAPARKTATVKKTVTKKTVTAGPAGKSAKKPVKKTAKRVPDGVAAPGDGLPAPAVATAPEAAPGDLAVRPGEEPWTPEEVAEAREGLLAEKTRLTDEIQSSEEAITGLMRDSGDGAGDDQADTGTKNITREHELALAANAREMLQQTVHALERIDTGTYGLCESCGKPIGKGRMLAFPRATLCVECKQREERR